LQFFGPNGEHWLQHDYHGRKRRCLVDAIRHVWRKSRRRITSDTVTFYLIEAIQPEPRPPEWALAARCVHLQDFNDQCGSFADLHAVIVKARMLARHDAERHQPEAIAPKPKRQTAAENKRQLLAELERERMQRHAAGDTSETFILCPRAPAPPSKPQRLAA
jgi:hypothetical protein